MRKKLNSKKYFITMKDKPWYKSKSILAGIVLILYGLYCIFTGHTESWDEISKIIIAIFTGTGIIGLRQAIAKLYAEKL